MSFLERIKKGMADPRNNYGGFNRKVSINYSDLCELINHFERLDSEQRAFHIDSSDDFYRLIRSNITAAYHHSRKDSVAVMTLAMEIVTELRKKEFDNADQNRSMKTGKFHL